MVSRPLTSRHRTRAIGAVLAAASIGCSGTIEGGGHHSDDAPRSSGGASASNGGGTGGAHAASGGAASGGEGAIDPAECGDGLTSRRLRRLSVREYAGVVSDLLGAEFGDDVLATLAFEPRLGGFDNQDSALFVSASFQEDVAKLAQDLASKIDVASLAPCPDSDGSDACLEAFTGAFAERAYGRPLSAAEEERLAKVAATAEDYPTSVRLVVEVVLQSPNFLYVSELGPVDAAADPGQPVALTQYEIASQLSFLLLGSRPDAILLEKAQTNGLARAEAIEAEAERLLQSDAGRASLSRFVTGWLDMAPIAEAPKSTVAFPELTDLVVTAMQREFDGFLNQQIAGGEGTLTALMTAQSADIPTALAPIYGADLDPDAGLDPTRRVGVLSLPGLLTYHASNQHSGPVERGLFVRRQLLCQEVPPPPPSVLDRIADNPVDSGDTTKTTRQKFEVHLDEPSCSACHLQFDPIGFGLEQMDGIGRFRTLENGLLVDSRGALHETDVDGPFEGVVELSNKLSESAAFEACMAEHFFRFAESRPPEAGDRCVVESFADRFAASGGRLKELVLAYVSHPSFALRKEDR